MDIFTKYYNDNFWGDNESISGPGSTIERTENIRKAIPEIIKKYDIHLILDAPCGDFNWFKLTKRNIPYIGGDIVKELIEKNQVRYEDEITTFVELDITQDKLPDADLMIIRDCWPHFSDADIKKSIKNFMDSNIKYLLTTNCGISDNKDIETGRFRFLNLFVEPFSFGYPLQVINEWNWDTFPPKTLMLFNREAIKL